ncbi:MAG: caspase domain-containing protein [Cyclobacteriaceae bacterium]
MKRNMMTGMFLAILFNAFSQTLTDRSHSFSLKKGEVKSSVPLITWEAPVNSIVFHRDAKLFVRVVIDSPVPLSVVELSISDNDKGMVRGSQMITPKTNEKTKLIIEKSIAMPEGVHKLEIVATNVDGVVSRSHRMVHAGETALSNAAKLNRNDYALLILTDKYDNWSPLVNPVFDGRTIAAELQNTYGFKVEVLENPSQDLVFRKLREYSEMRYEPLDQLMIFFAGHGYYDETFKEGYAVVKESLKDDPGRTSYISYNRLRNVVNVIPCEHVLLMMDVCFGGTIDEALAKARADDDIYGDVSQADFIIRKLTNKTRKYLTSGGKTYVSDGIAGKHSPFAARVIEAFKTYGGNDGILTLTELWPYVEKLTPEPRLGKFGDDAPGSEFVFVVK